MNSLQTFDQILDRCLADLHAQRATLDDCLRAYPEMASELAPLLAIATAIEAAPDVQPNPSFIRATRAQFLSLPQPMTRSSPWGHFVGLLMGSAPRLASLAVVLIVLVVTGAGTLYAANESLPGSPLYAMKRGIENWQLAWTGDGESRARMELAFAQRRFDETLTLLATGNTDFAGQTAREYTSLMNQLLTSSASSALAPQLKDTLLQQSAQLQAAHVDPSSTVFTSLQQTVNLSLSAVAQPTPTTNGTLVPSPTATDTLAAPSGTPTTVASDTPTVLPVQLPTVSLPSATLDAAVPTVIGVPPVLPSATRAPVVPTATRPPAAPTATRPPAAPTATRTPTPKPINTLVLPLPTTNVLPTLVPTLPGLTVAPTVPVPTLQPIVPTLPPVGTLPVIATVPVKVTPPALPTLIPTIRLP